MDSGFNKFLDTLGAVPVALGHVLASDAIQVGVVAGGAALVLGIGVAAAYGLQSLANKARRNKRATHWGTPAE